MDEVKNTGWFLSWEEYGGRKNDSAYAGMTNPLAKLASTTSLITFLVSAGGIIAFVFILIKSNKGRRDEAILQHTLGESKIKMIWQRIWEVLLPAIIAVVAAVALSYALITPITDTIHENAKIAAQAEERYSYEYFTPLSTRGISDAIITDNGTLPEDIDFDIAFPEISTGVFVCCGISTAAAFVISAITIKKLNRKERY